MCHKKCADCPIIPESDMAENALNWWCLPDRAQAVKCYKETWKVWACHEKPTKPCVWLLRVLKEEWIPINLSKPLITEQTSTEEIYS